MLSKDAIQELSQAEAISAADAAIANGENRGVVALPNHFQVHDLEKHLPNRRRQRGTMTTALLADFARYVSEQRSIAGAAVFVDGQKMEAVAVLNLGTPMIPGHCDHRAVFTPPATSALRALAQIADRPQSQKAIAEFAEDWLPHITFTDGDGEELDPAQCIRAIRSITIEAKREGESQVQDLRAERSELESIVAKTKADGAKLPARVNFICVPHLGLRHRMFAMRVSVVTANPKEPAITLRVIQREKHNEEMAEELATLVRASVGESMPVLVGTLNA